jgi:polyphosphate kinase
MLPPLPVLTPDNYINRELSAIAFNQRVLALAQNTDIPLLERVRFLAIVGNNLDEFFMVRVSSYIKKVHMGLDTARPDGIPPNQLLYIIRERVIALLGDLRSTLRDLLNELDQQGIRVHAIQSLSATDRAAISQFFEEEIFPILTPLAADGARPFPFISNLSMNIAVHLVENGKDPTDPENYLFVRLKIPETLPRFVDLNRIRRRYGSADSAFTHDFVWIEEVIADNLSLLCPGMTVVEQHPFRVTRNADIDYENELEDDSDDFADMIENSLRDRRFGEIVRLTVQDTITAPMLKRLADELEIDHERDVYIIDGALGSSSMAELASIDRPDLKYPRYIPRQPEMLQGYQDLFSAIRAGDVVMHLPYESFTPVEEFFAAAARDPQVVAIKATLYRVGKNSPLVKSLLEARDNDKQVTVLVELKARFDEENNLEWARALEQNGVHVIYGVEKFEVKTHAKVCLVIRKEGDMLRRYVHIGTGNYNTTTARFYTDVGLFTCNTEIADDATRLFNRLTGYAPLTTYKRLLVAPDYLLNSILTLIDAEAEAALQGKPAHIIMKMNQLEEDKVIQALYRASQVGVKVDLIVRGLCCLRPGISGLSENIRVYGITGRYLEHSRIFYFKNAPQDRRVYIGSADMMRRNLYNRVEVVTPIIDQRTQQRLLRILATDLQNTTGGWELLSSGEYVRKTPSPDQPTIDSQALFMQDAFGLNQQP